MAQQAIAHLTIHTDGGARGNPGPGAIGIVIKNGNENLLELGLSIGICTNNEAEYSALIKGLGEALRMGAKTASCFLDSELVVNQLTGMYKVKNDRMAKLWAEAKNLEKKFENVTYKSVPRKENARADMLVNKALDAQKI